MVTGGPLKYTIEPVDTIPVYFKSGSAYDPILEAFMKLNIEFAELKIDGKTPAATYCGVNQIISRRKFPIKAHKRRSIIYLRRKMYLWRNY